MDALGTPKNWEQNFLKSPIQNETKRYSSTKSRAARRPLARVSAKKAKWHRQYIAALKQAIESDLWCRRCRKRKANQGHHPAGQQGANIMIFHPFCQPCHTWVEDHKNEARTEGWITYK